MGKSSQDVTIKEQTLFYLEDCVKELGTLRLNRAKTKKVLSPCLTDISKCPSFHNLIHLCSEHDPTILKSVLRIALDKCTEAEKQKYKKDPKKREAEIPLGRKSHKQAKVRHLRKGTTALNSMFVPKQVVDAKQSTVATLAPSSMRNQLQSSVPASPVPQGVGLTNNPAKTKTPTIYEVELGLVRGEERIKEYVMGECLPFSENELSSSKDELRALFLTCRKFPFSIVKSRLLRELESRIVVPGQRTAIPSTAEMSKPSEILDALQSIKMTTINAKVHRAYGQMRLYNSVQGKIGGAYVLDKSLEHGVAPHRSILGQMAWRLAGKVSEKEQTERKNSYYYEYDAGKKWLEVTKWFGGEGIVLIFATAGVWHQNLFFVWLSKQCSCVTGIGNSLVTKDWTNFQRVCMEIISDHLPGITGLVDVLGEKALDDYCRYGHLDQEKIDAVVAFQGCRSPVTETEEDSAEDEDEISEA